jgi:heme exporter protein C
MRIFSLFAILVAATLIFALYLVFMYVPNERIMGPMQRILYFHAGSATACYVAVFAMFAGALAYLFTKKDSFDRLIQSGTEVALVFASATLFSGMIWGQAAWNTYFRFEPRLVSTLILWLMLFGGLVFRFLTPYENRPKFASVLAILSAVMVPVVIYSVELLPNTVQVHPQVVGDGGLRDPRFGQAFGVSILACSLLAIQLVWFGVILRSLEDKVYGS